MTNETTPNLLKNWTIVTWMKGQVFIVGNIYNATNGVTKDGTRIRTSSVQYIDLVAGAVRTLNSIYNLDKGGYIYDRRTDY